MASEEPSQRNGNLKIPLPFDEALKAALRVKPNGKPEAKPKPKKKPAKS
jgi:hypothetical protein